MSTLDNFIQHDPFADDGDENKGASSQENIHIRIQQRNGRKTLTTVQGLPKDLDPKRILKALKKDFACNGNIVNDKDLGDVIQLQGDQRGKVQDFIQSIGIDKKIIKIHGF